MTRPTPELKAAIVADRAAGMTGPEVAEKYGVSKASVNRYYRAHIDAIDPNRKPLRPRHSAATRHAALNDYYTSGDSLNVIAKRHGVSRCSLTGWIDADEGVELSGGRWVLDPQRRIQVWEAA